MNYKLNNFEAIMIIVTLLCTKLFVAYPLIESAFSGIQMILINLIAFFAVWLIFFVSSKFKFTTFHALKGILLSILTIVTVVFTGVNFSKFVFSLKWSLLNNSPETFISIILLVGIIFGVFSGIKGIGRLCGFFTPLILITSVMLIIPAFKGFRFQNLFPVFGSGIKETFLFGLFMLSSLWEAVFISFIPPFLKKRDSLSHIVTFSFLISFLFYAFVGVAVVLIKTGNVSEFSEIFKIIRTINPLSFSERPDSVFYILYVLLVLLYFSVIVFFVKHIFSEYFKVKYSDELILPFVLLIAQAGFTVLDYTYVRAVYDTMFNAMWLIPVLLPIFFYRRKT